MENKKVILAVSFGTSFPDARENAIGGIEKALKAAFPEYEVRRCFTSGMVAKHVKESEGIDIDTPEKALEKAAADGISELLVQPTHVMSGAEYRKFMNVLEKYRGRFETVKTGSPLLSEPEDYKAVISALKKIAHAGAAENKEDIKTAVVLVGHGSGTDADSVYAQLQRCLSEQGLDNYYVGTIESHPTADELLEIIRKKDYGRVVLVPFMVVAGDHAANDIAGNVNAGNDGSGQEETSWKKIFSEAGYEVIPVMKGLGEYPEIQQIYVDHMKKA